MSEDIENKEVRRVNTDEVCAGPSINVTRSFKLNLLRVVRVAAIICLLSSKVMISAFVDLVPMYQANAL